VTWIGLINRLLLPSLKKWITDANYLKEVMDFWEEGHGAQTSTISVSESDQEENILTGTQKRSRHMKQIRAKIGAIKVMDAFSEIELRIKLTIYILEVFKSF